MSNYFVFQVPYQEEESEFLLHVLQTAAKAHREFHEKSADVTALPTYSAADNASYFLIKEETDDCSPTSTSMLRSIF